MRMSIETFKEEIDRWEKDLIKQKINSSPGDYNLLYTPLNIQNEEDNTYNYYLSNIGFPGKFPFTRGIYPAMYRGKLWTMRQITGFTSPTETNARLKSLLRQGQTGLNIVFDLPTVIGLDSDHPMAEGEVGRCGVAIDTLIDMEELFKDVPIENIDVELLGCSGGNIWVFSCFLVTTQKRGLDIKKLSGGVQNDFLGFMGSIPRCCIFAPRTGLKLAADIVEFVAKNKMTRYIAINFNGHLAREGGATMQMELQICFGNAISMIETLLSRGLKIEDFISSFGFYTSIHNDFFENVAKLRAMRRAWAKILKEQFRVKDEKLMRFKVHAQESPTVLTAQQPLNNVIRTSIQAVAAVLGGCQSLEVNPMDEVLSIPTEETQKLALRTQQIIAHETGLAETIDPLAGSYFVEALTDKIEKGIRNSLTELENMGSGSISEGVLRGLENGYFLKETAKQASRTQREIESGEKIVVGLNKYIEDEKPVIKIEKIDPLFEERKISKLKKYREERNSSDLKNHLARLSRAAEKRKNVIPEVIECVKAGATEGEVIKALTDIYGEYKTFTVI